MRTCLNTILRANSAQGHNRTVRSTDANVRPNQRVRSEPPDESARPRTVARQHPTDRTRDADRTSRTACAPLPALAF